MKGLALIILLWGTAFATGAQVNDSASVSRIREEILLHGTCYENLRTLTKTIGHRLSGSPASYKAIEWGRKALQAAGADSVWLQPVRVPHWVRGKESLKIRPAAAADFEPVKMLSLGNAVGTDGRPLQAEILLVQTIDEFRALRPAAVRGKIVFFNYRFRQDLLSTFEGYGDAIKYRWMTPGLVGAKGGVAVIIRSVSTGLDNVPHTGTTRYYDTIPKVPAVAIGNTTADALEAMLLKGNVTAQLNTNCKMMDSVLSYNVIGELHGSTLPGEYLVCGGHLDSWDVGEGAHDDGAGCVQAIEVIRTFSALGMRPKRSVRAVLYMNEENGSRGGRAYADSAAAKKERHILAMESDAGGFSPRGIGLDMDEGRKQLFRRQYGPLFAAMNVYDFSLEEGGVDIDPLKKLGVPLAGLVPDQQRYFDYHHTERDVFEAVNHRELKLGAATMAAVMWLISEHGL